MTKDEAQAVLEEGGCRISSQQRLPNDTGWQIRLDGGGIVNIYDSGKFNVQGKGREAIDALFGKAAADSGGAAAVTAGKAAKGRNVFVVYGHDKRAREGLENMLRRWQINPLILEQLPSEGQTIIEKLERVQGLADFAVVLATPDDEGHRAGHADEKKFRARQNVVLELGMLLQVVGRRKVAVLLNTDEDMERPSDIQGLLYIPFRDDVAEASIPLAKELNAVGIKINLDHL
ncbi:MAG: nucleotide-binding protein [Bauldia sp.]|nr:nucleotide-binding protein [Bauldia sp.]MCW5717947.1 nucleotide-binding protein [Bauldia sp.]